MTAQNGVRGRRHVRQNVGDFPSEEFTGHECPEEVHRGHRPESQWPQDLHDINFLQIHDRHGGWNKSEHHHPGSALAVFSAL